MVRAVTRTKFQLKDGDADELRASGFVIRDDNVVEWVAVDGTNPSFYLVDAVLPFEKTLLRIPSSTR